VGTVGGGTRLPTAAECLRIVRCEGEGKASKFAEICAAMALAGEISIAGAMCAGHFARAHEELGRSGDAVSRDGRDAPERAGDA
jgi:hydroxymethylglutaryl-CoA reductase (NADPH)